MKAVAVAVTQRAAPARRRSQRRPTSTWRAGLEQRAEMAAARAIRHQRVVAAALGRAPPARSPCATSPGSALPADLRAPLERAFDADLGAVRIHLDDATRSVVRAAGAAGLAAGRDVYLDLDADRLRSEPGRRLLAHEVAHVLQQTGRLDRTGRLHATDRAGSAAPQRADQFVGYCAWFGVFQPTPTWAEIEKQYLGVPGFTAHQAIVTRHVPVSGPASKAAIRAMVAETRKPSFARLSDDLKAYYVDALKFVGANRDAARLVLAHRNLSTTWRSQALYQAVRARSKKWMPGYARRHRFLKAYYPSRLIAVHRHLFHAPGQRPPDLDPDAWRRGAKSFETKILDELDALKNATGRVPNELEATALMAMYYVDKDRRQLHQQLLTTVHHRTTSIVDRHIYMATSYARGTAESTDLSGLAWAPEAHALFTAAFPRIQKAAETAVAYWQKAVGFHTAHTSKAAFGAMTAREVAAIARRLRTERRFRRLRPTLRATARNIFAVARRGALPSPARFARTVRRSRSAIRQLMAYYSIYLADLAHRRKQTEPEALALGLALLYLNRVEHPLRRYDPADDRRMQRQYKRTDQRDAVRFRLAAQMQIIGIREGWDELRRAANKVYARGTRLTVALLSPWKPDPSAKAEDMERDLGGSLVGFGGLISGVALSTFVDAQQWHGFSDLIDKRLSRRASDFRDTKPILTEAFAALEKAPRMRRWLCHDWAVGSPSRQRPYRGGGSMYSFGDRLHAHPFTKAVKANAPAGSWSLVPSNPIADGRAIPLWVVPRVDELALRLARFGTLATDVDAEWRRAHGGAPAPDPKTRPLAWMVALGDYVIELMNDPKRAATLKRLETDVPAHIVKLHDRARLRALASGRRATSHQRRVVVGVVSKLLDGLDRDENFDRHTVPRKAFAVMQKFSDLVWPETDLTRQMTALWIEIAPSIMRAFGPKKRFLFDRSVIDYRHDYMATLLRGTWGALAVWDRARRKVTPAHPVDDITSLSWLSLAAMTSRVSTLRSFHRSLHGKVWSVMKARGLRGVKGNELVSVYWDRRAWTLLKLTGAMTRLKVNKGVPYGKFGYLLVDVLADFTFVPRFASPDSLGVEWPKGWHPGDAEVLDSRGRRLAAATKLLTYSRIPMAGGPGTMFTVTAGDLGRLEHLYDVIDSAFGRAYLHAAGVFVTKYAELVTDVLSFAFPVVDKVVTLAKVAAAVNQVLADPTFRAILASFADDGVKAFEKIFAAITQVLDLEQLVNVLLFDADFTSKVRNHPRIKGDTSRQQKASSRGGLFAQIGRVLKNVVEIGLRVLDAIKRVVKRVQVPVRDAQLWVLRHPAAAMVLELIERAGPVLGKLSLSDLADTVADMSDRRWQKMIQKAVNDALQGVVDRGRSALDQLRHLEMPEQVIPEGMLADFVVSLMVQLLGAKYKRGIEAVRGMLRTVGLWSKITRGIESVLGVDPNQPYRTYIRAKLQPYFSSARDSFVSELVGFLKGVPFLSALTAAKGTPIKFSLSGVFADTPSFEMFGSASATTAAAAGPPPTPSGGAPLAPSQRARAELGLCHDLSHVRVHRGADAARWTGPVGAEGVTTGSHVYLRPGLDLDTGFGARVLHHELGHVLQQTGPRPLGRSHDAGPVAGAPGRGLIHDAGREAAADRVAAAVAGGGVASSPIAAGGPAVGVQPFSTKFLRGFLAHLHGGGDLIEARKEVEKAAKRPVKLDPTSQAVADALTTALRRRLKHLVWSSFGAPFNSAHRDLAKLAAAKADAIAAVVPVLVQRALTTVKPPLSAKAPTLTVAYLPPDALRVHLERHLYAVTGMAMVIKLHERRRGPAEVGRRPVINERSPLTSLVVAYVHLPFLEPGTDTDALWDRLVENTFKGTSGYARTSHAEWVGTTKLVLGKSGPRPDTYDRRAFKLSPRRAKVVRNQHQRIEKILTRKVPATARWPNRTEYVETEASKVRAEVRDYGLRLGTYAGWKGRSGTDRDAHHTVQYLLFQYLRNVKSLQPLPHLAAVAHPGVTRRSGHVAKIAGDAGTIDVGTYYPGRGGAMPTIYIARHTHQSGIHYRTEPPDDDSAARPTQGFAIHATFRRLLGGHVKHVDDLATLRALARKPASQQDDLLPGKTPLLSKRRLKNAIFTAARNTYRDMWKEMKGKLKTALRTQEVAYYNTVARRVGAKADMTASAMDAPFRAAVTRTQHVIGGAMAWPDKVP